MAKGRKLTQSRSERYLGSYSSYSHAQESPEFDEDDVWSTIVESVEEKEVDNEVENSLSEWSPRVSGESNIGGAFAAMRTRRMSRDDDYSNGGVGGGLSLAFVDVDSSSSPRIVHQFRGRDGTRGRHMATSLPMNVPDWSKILRVDSGESLHEFDDGMDSSNDPEMIPPHEYLAREYTRGATSVFEGVGRTLKGRDMRRVRDAVWSRTGFDG